MALRVVILAAGRGKRMTSNFPKLLHQLAGKSLLEHVVNAASPFTTAQPVIVYGYQGDQLRKSLSHLNALWVEQKEQLGTGHALLQAMEAIQDKDHVLVLNGDIPLISKETLNRLIEATPKTSLGLVTAILPKPSGYGRIKRNKDGKITAVVEEPDASPEERKIKEVNGGIYLAQANLLKKWLLLIENKNAQKEFYITDMIQLSVENHVSIHNIQPLNYEEILGVNNYAQLVNLETIYRRMNQKEKEET